MQEVTAGGCLSEDTLLDLFGGKLSPEALLTVERHLDRCGSCRDVVGQATSEPSPAPAPDAPILPADSVIAQRYRVVRFIGRGGMGEVYEAEDRELGEHIAIKTLTAAVAADPSMVSRLKREVQLARKVTHPHVCRIFDFGSERLPAHPGQPRTFLTMELLEGETLRQRLRRGPLPLAEALQLARQLVSGLQAAHAAGVIHRDFKSDNVLLLGGGAASRAVITDFGLARADVEVTLRSDGGLGRAVWPGNVRISSSGVLIGTPAYMAPEQVLGSELTPAADIYAFGVVLFEMLTGELPFAGRSPLATAYERLKRPAPSPRQRVPELPAEVDALVLKCLERTPADRFSGAAALQHALAGDLGATLRRRGPTRVWAGGAAVTLTAVAAIGWALGRPAPPALANAATAARVAAVPAVAAPAARAPAPATAARPTSPRLVVQADASDARVEVDGQPLPSLAGVAQLDVSPGLHRVVVSAPGRQRWRDAVLVPGEGTLRLPVRLRRAAATHAKPAPSDDEGPHPYPSAR